MKKNTRENVVIILLAVVLVSLFVLAFATPIKYPDCPASETTQQTPGPDYALTIVRL